MLIWVYWTLKQGYGNHYLLWWRKPVMYDFAPAKHLAGRWFPYISPGNWWKVLIEVYSVDKETLNRLDQLEWHPNWYKRQKVKTENWKYVWVYYYNDLVDDDISEWEFIEWTSYCSWWDRYVLEKAFKQLKFDRWEI